MSNILILVDMQRGFCKKPQTVKLVEDVEVLLDRNIFDCVVATKFLNGDNSVYETLLSWKKFKSNIDCNIVKELQKSVDYTVTKRIYTCVNTTFLQQLCQLNGGRYPEQVFVAGVDTDCCVLATAVGLFESNIRPIVLANYCASNGGKESHEAGLLCLKRLIGERQIINKTITQRGDLNTYEQEAVEK